MSKFFLIGIIVQLTCAIAASIGIAVLLNPSSGAVIIGMLLIAATIAIGVTLISSIR